MDRLRLIHRENLNRLLEKQSELEQKLCSALRLLSTAKRSTHIKEIRFFWSILDHPITDMFVILSKRKRLTLRFSGLNVSCHEEDHINWVIRSSLDLRYREIDQFFGGRYYVQDNVENFLGPERCEQFPLKNFSGLNRTPNRLLTVVCQETDEYFWENVGRLNNYFLLLPLDNNYGGMYISGKQPIVDYISELMKRCLLATSVDIVNRLQQCIIRLLAFCRCDIDKNRDYIKCFQPIFPRSTKLSMTACLTTIVNFCGGDPSSKSIIARVRYNGDLSNNMIVLVWLKEYLHVYYQDDVVDPIIAHAKMVYDRFYGI